MERLTSGPAHSHWASISNIQPAGQSYQHLSSGVLHLMIGSPTSASAPQQISHRDTLRIAPFSTTGTQGLVTGTFVSTQLMTKSLLVFNACSAVTSSDHPCVLVLTVLFKTVALGPTVPRQVSPCPCIAFVPSYQTLYNALPFF